MAKPFSCLVVGHRWEFDAHDATLWWRCGRGCGVGGSREYETPQEARKYAALLNDGAPKPPLGFLSALGGTVHREPKDRGSRGSD